MGGVRGDGYYIARRDGETFAVYPAETLAAYDDVYFVGGVGVFLHHGFVFQIAPS
jgi:hypothetical protein